MGKIKSKIEPLESKHYEAVIIYGDITIRLTDSKPYKSGPSFREVVYNGWQPEDGMNHVESRNLWNITRQICIFLDGLEVNNGS